jgi:hypothetical protein
VSFDDWFTWVTLAIWWACILRNLQLIRRNKRRGRDLARQEIETMVARTGLTPLQIQVAIDASMAAFMQRVEELQRSTRG